MITIDLNQEDQRRLAKILDAIARHGFAAGLRSIFRRTSWTYEAILMAQLASALARGEPVLILDANAHQRRRATCDTNATSPPPPS